MKNSLYALVITSAAYSYLFFEQNAGVNFLVFNFLVILFTWFKWPQLHRSTRWLWTVLLCLCSATGIVLNSSALAIIANIVSLLLFSAVSFNQRTSSLFGLAFSGLSVFFSPVFIFLDLKKRRLEEQKSGKWKVLIIACITFLFSALFFALFKDANPLFAENMKWLNLDFISFHWFVFTGLGFLVCFGLLQHHSISFVEHWENNLSTENRASDHTDSEKFSIERQTGLIIFALLNLMLLILNIGDINSLILGGKLPAGISHADFVHKGVGNLIFSIIIAAGLVMFLFRRDFRQLQLSKGLRFLVMLWALQSILMLISAAQRNSIYIENFSLTHKRIGVYVWLLLAALGVITILIKVLLEKSNWYLVRVNFSVWLTVLAIGGLFSWDVMIARYNLKNKTIGEIDFEYIFDLSDAVIPELQKFAETPQHVRFIDTGLAAHQSLRANFNKRLHGKVLHYLDDYSNDWQSWDLRDEEITKSLLKK